MRVWLMSAAVLLAASEAEAASRTIQYAPAPAWVAAPPAPTGTPPLEGAPVQVIYSDVQARLGPDGDETYSAYRVKILRPEALSVGNISAVWNPSQDDIFVHRLSIIRNGQVTDVLRANKFTIVQRENQIDYAVLQGDLTAALAIPGVQVGDEVEFAATIKRRDPTLAGRSQVLQRLPMTGMPGVFRTRVSWPAASQMRWKATDDLAGREPQQDGDRKVLTLELRDPSSVILDDGAPPRFGLKRAVEFTSFADWSEVANLLQPLFEKAAVLAPASPVRAEAAKIAAATKDPSERADAALRLVQDRIRYVYVELDDGNYRPAAADETWARRFGDCKAKTVLLIALLRELGVPTEAVLVNSEGGDGLDERLPSLGPFDHVLVRTRLGDRSYWLDGTHMGERLNRLPPVIYRWGLPLRSGKVDLEALAPTPPTTPQLSVLLDVDATAGVKAPAKVKAEQVLRGDGVGTFRAQLSSISRQDAERMLKAFWREQVDWAEPDTAGWRYDEEQGALVLTMAGEGKPEWEGDDEKGWMLSVPNAGFSPPAEFKRPKEQNQATPWATDFPLYNRWTTLIRLPPESAGRRWSYRAAPVDLKLGGVSYHRDADLRDGLLRITMSRRVYKPEISAEEAKAVNDGLAKFDNNISQVFQSDRKGGEAAPEEDIAKAEAAAGRNPERLFWVGAYQFTRGRYDEAIRLADKALRTDAAYDRAIILKADALRLKGDEAAALRVLEAAQGSPSGDVARARAAALFRADRADEGQAVLDAAAAKATDAALLARLAETAAAAGRLDWALARIDAAIKLQPDEALWRQERGMFLQRAGRWAEALTEYDAAIAMAPESASGFRARARIERHLGRLPAALADLEEAARINPTDEALLSERAKALAGAGRPGEGVALFEDWVARDKSGVALNNRCWARSLMNFELAKAEADCALAVKIGPKTAGFWDSYGLVALRAGRYDDAIRRYDQAISIVPRLAPSLYARGIAKLRAGDAAGGRADIAAAQAISPWVGEELADAGVTP